jgi:proteasome lid subunit RPN8/RPN11
VLRLSLVVFEEMVAHALGGFPDEACGLLGGRIDGETESDDIPVVTVEHFVAARNHDASSRTYTVGPEAFLAADRELEPRGLDVVGVMHSHTHSEAWPSPTDIDKADNPHLAGWHYVIVSLRDPSPVLRSFVLDDRTIREEVVELQPSS